MPNLLNLTQMAKLLRVKQVWLRSEAEAGRIPNVPAGDTFLFAPDVVIGVLRRRAEVGRPSSPADDDAPLARIGEQAPVGT